MRYALAILLALCAVARADDFKKYEGKLVLSPDAPPLGAAELPKYLAANMTKDGHYELIKQPWDIHAVGVLAKDVSPVTVVVTEDGAKEPAITAEVTSKRKIVVWHVTFTTAAGFAAGKSYTLELRSDKKVLASASLTLRR